VTTRAELWERRLSAPMLVAAVLVIPAIVLDAGDYGSTWSTLGEILNWATWLAFAGELVIMLVVVDDRRAWLREHPLEVAVTLFSPPILPGPLQSIRILRLLRLLRLARTAKVLHRLMTPAGLRDAAVLTTLVVLAGGVAFSEVETGQHLSTWDGVWWAMSTITTVGYGDVTPVTTAGRIIAIVVMVAGIGFVALLTASIAHRFVTHTAAEEHAQVGREEEILQELRGLHDRLDRFERQLLDRAPESDERAA
jgi:voltage-gated potassium channel